MKKIDDVKLKRIEKNPKVFNALQYASSLKISFSTLALGVRYFPNELFSGGKYANEDYGNWSIYFTVNLPGANRKKKLSLLNELPFGCFGMPLASSRIAIHLTQRMFVSIGYQ